jgi:D-threo-aldose 1-dehydrogenase
MTKLWWSRVAFQISYICSAKSRVNNVVVGNKMNWDFPSIVFGVTSFGNHYQEVPYEQKLKMAQKWFDSIPGKVVLDTAGKYGAGLSLEMIGRVLRDLSIPPERVVISNKLGWKRVELMTPEPTFEPGGTWVNIKHDAKQFISYEGIIDCHQQGCELLGEPYRPSLLSIHDPDEYLSKAMSEKDRESKLDDVIGAYQALKDIKKKESIFGIGLGVKNWKVIPEIIEKVDLDWVMLACSLTPYRHDSKLLALIEDLRQKNISIVNSAVYNAGFLLGGDFFDYRKPNADIEPDLFKWRDDFLETCRELKVSASDVCIQFGMQIPGVRATALNTSKLDRIDEHIQAVDKRIPNQVWDVLYNRNLIKIKLPYEN